MVAGGTGRHQTHPKLTDQILTKRPQLIAGRLPADWHDGYPNVWLGVSVENKRFLARMDTLRKIPAVIRIHLGRATAPGHHAGIGEAPLSPPAMIRSNP